MVNSTLLPIKTRTTSVFASSLSSSSSSSMALPRPALPARKRKRYDATTIGFMLIRRTTTNTNELSYPTGEATASSMPIFHNPPSRSYSTWCGCQPCAAVVFKTSFVNVFILLLFVSLCRVLFRENTIDVHGGRQQGSARPKFQHPMTGLETQRLISVVHYRDKSTYENAAASFRLDHHEVVSRTSTEIQYEKGARDRNETGLLLKNRDPMHTLLEIADEPQQTVFNDYVKYNQAGLRREASRLDDRVITQQVETPGLGQSFVSNGTDTTWTAMQAYEAPNSSSISDRVKRIKMKKKQLKMDPSAIPLSHFFADEPYFGYRSLDEMNTRSERFPSFEQRLMVYMNGWYIPPCSDPHSQSHVAIHYTWRNDTSSNKKPHPYLLIREQPYPNISNFMSLLQTPSQSNGSATIATTHPNQGVTVPRIFYVDGRIVNEERGGGDFNRMIYLDREQMQRCQQRYNQCESDVNTFFPALDRVQHEINNRAVPASSSTPHKTNQKRRQEEKIREEIENFPLLLQYGDTEMAKAFNIETQQLENYPNIPVVKKFRWAYENPDTLMRMATNMRCNDGGSEMLRYQAETVNVQGHSRFQPILWKQKIKRHYGMLPMIPQFDRRWSSKKNAAVFRGALTGIHSGDLLVEHLTSLSDKEKCMRIPRCRLVFQCAQSTFVDARLTDYAAKNSPIAPVIDGVAIYGDRLDFRQMLRYKAIIMPQGNDVSTGMKWALFSNSVVMFPPPTLTSWPMEELLQPWVHYIPIQSDFQEIVEKVQWILDHDNEAQAIAHRGSLWIRDLLIHPDANYEEQRIFDAIIRRFQAHFVRSTNTHILPSHLTSWKPHVPNTTMNE